MTLPTSLVGVAIKLLIALPITLAVLVRIFEDHPPAIGWLLVQLHLMLAAATLIGGLSLFPLLKVAGYPKLTSNVPVTGARKLACARPR
jgi:hypothetical protein